MIRFRRRALVALAFILTLAACSQQVHLESPEGSSAALITDLDLDRAATEVARREVVVQGIEQGTATTAEVPSPAPAEERSSQAVLPNVGGYLTYLRVLQGGSPTWQIWLANQSTDQKTLVYEGSRMVTSAAVNLAGDILFFTAQVSVGSSNTDVYRLTRNDGAVTRLTTTSTAEADISVSASGRTVVWGGVHASTGKRAVYLRDYSGTSFSQKVLAISSGNQVEPTVSGDGAYVALIRTAKSTQVLRFRKSNSSYLVVATPPTSVHVRAPSVSNGGLKVAWGEDVKATGSSTIRVKTISGGKVVSAGSSSSRIRQPQLTSDGGFITYAVLHGGTLNVSTKNLASGQVARLTADTVSTISNVEAFWQKGAASRGLTISGTVSAASVSTSSAHDSISPTTLPVFRESTAAPFVPGEVIVGFKPGFRAQALSAGLGLEPVRRLSLGHTGLYRIGGAFRRQSGDLGAETLRLVRQLSARDDVLYAHPNYLVEAFAEPNDPLYGDQWHYRTINLPAAWAMATGSSGVTVAVLDTGIATGHPDFAGKLLPGYNFVAAEGRGSDPTDPGGNSGYHGTHVAGTIGAATNNGVGVAGVSWGARLLPVRVLGQSGGNLADTIDGILWSVGLPVSGAPTNANPAQVLNLSLGGPFLCSEVPALQDALDQAAATGATVVVAAGNENTDASGVTPASCGGVITVGATDLRGGRAAYSNYGARIDVMAPGGDLSRDDNSDGNPDGVLSTLRDTFSGEDIYGYLDGTSMATPHVAGLVALMKTLRPSLTNNQVRDLLVRTAQPISGGGCGVGCGAGLIDAAAALRALSGNVDVKDTVVFACPISATTCTVNQLPSVKLSRSGSSAPFELTDVPTGDFYIYAWKDANSNKTLDGGELFGAHQRNGVLTAVKPSATNINLSLAPAPANRKGQAIRIAP